MRYSLFPSDDSLPTWLHTALIFLILSPLLGFFLWYGVSAIALGSLEPLSGPEFGEYLFGKATLHGRAARIAGVSLLVDGASLIALGIRFSRLEAARSAIGPVMPWALLGLAIMLSYFVRA